MKYTITVLPRAARELKKLTEDTRKRIQPVIESLADEPRPQGCKKLHGEDAYRVRVGDYRIVYQIRDSVLIVQVIRVRHRREVY